MHAHVCNCGTARSNANYNSMFTYYVCAMKLHIITRRSSDREQCCRRKVQVSNCRAKEKLKRWAADK